MRCDRTAAWAALRRPLRGARPRLRPARGLRARPGPLRGALGFEAPEVFADLSKNLRRHRDPALPARPGARMRRRGAARRDARRRADQHHRRPRRAAHGAARAARRGARSAPRCTACSTRCWPSPSAVRAPTAPRGISATSSTSASAAATSGRRWRCRRSTRSCIRGSRFHFVSNVDGHDIAPVLRALRAGRDAVHRRQQDLHDAGDDGQRAIGASAWFVAARRHRHRATTSSRTTTNVEAARALRHRHAPSASGTGSAAAIRCGRRSACRSRSPSAPSGFRALLAGAHAMDEHFADRAARAEPAGAARPARRLVPQLPRLHEPQRRALPPGRCSACRPTCSSSRWRATASASTAHGAAAAVRDLPGGLGRARHQRPARLLPDAAPGHGRRSRSSSSCRAPTQAGARRDAAAGASTRMLLANGLAQAQALMQGTQRRRRAAHRSTSPATGRARPAARAR